MKEALGNPATLTATAAAAWLFFMLGALMAFFAWMLVNLNCWWVGYFCGFITFFVVRLSGRNSVRQLVRGVLLACRCAVLTCAQIMFQVSVMFGVSSAVVIPFSDLCSGLPKVGEVPLLIL